MITLSGAGTLQLECANTEGDEKMTIRHATSLAMITLSLGALAASGCDDESEPIGTSKDELEVKMPAFDIPPGESFKCYYSDVITTEDLAVTGAVGVQVKGGHHLTMYYVDNHRPVGLQDCAGNVEMIDWHFVVGAGGEGNANDYIKLAEGLAYKVPAGKQLMVQAHYINVTGQNMPSADEMKLQLEDPAKVEQYAADFVVDDEEFELMPNAEMEKTSICEIPQDLQLTMLLGHMHERGSAYKLEVVDDAGKTVEVLYEHEWQPEYASHPPLLNYTKEAPLFFTKGTRLKQTCKWKNDSKDTLIFPTEMCIAFGTYFPGTERVTCNKIEVTE